MSQERVICLDEHNNPVGLMEKMDAHRRGIRHEAFSIFLFNEKDELLLQKRAHDKYHSAKLWANACCSHPRPKEVVEKAAQRRLREELGIKGISLIHCGHIHYETPVPPDLIENEWVHLFVGRIESTTSVPFNPAEVSDIKWVDPATITSDLQKNPQLYTAWIKAYIHKKPHLFSYLQGYLP